MRRIVEGHGPLARSTAETERAVVLARAGGHSVAEAARSLGITYKAAECALARAHGEPAGSAHPDYSVYHSTPPSCDLMIAEKFMAQLGRSTFVVAFVFAATAGGATGATGDAAGPNLAKAAGLPVLAEQQRYRAELGLPARTEVVTDLNARWASGDLPGASTEGAVFTAQEQEELDQRDEAGREIAAAARGYFVGSLAAAFGGVFIDHATGKTVVLVTRDTARHQGELRRRVRQSERVEIRAARFALADLDRITAWLTGKVAQLQAAGVQFSHFGPNEQDNMVDVALVLDSAADRAAVLDSLRPADAAMIRFSEAAPITMDGVATLNAPPLTSVTKIARRRCGSR